MGIRGDLRALAADHGRSWGSVSTRAIGGYDGAIRGHPWARGASLWVFVHAADRVYPWGSVGTRRPLWGLVGTRGRPWALVGIREHYTPPVGTSGLCVDVLGRPWASVGSRGHGHLWASVGDRRYAQKKRKKMFLTHSGTGGFIKNRRESRRLVARAMPPKIHSKTQQIISFCI